MKRWREGDKDKNIIVVKGSVPGHKNNFLIVKEAKKRPKGFVKRKAVMVLSKKGVKGQTQKK